MTERDKQIIQLLRNFRVLSRDQIGKLICPEAARPHVTVNRIAKRLCREGWILPVPQPKDRCYLYMPNPALIHMQSSKLQHFLGLVDVYIELGRPEIFQVEPQVTDEYRPDAYTRINGMPTMIEYQRSTVSLKKMQQKVDQFVQTHRKGKHDAKTLLVVTSIYYNLPEIPGYQIMQRALSR